ASLPARMGRGRPRPGAVLRPELHPNTAGAARVRCPGRDRQTPRPEEDPVNPKKQKEKERRRARKLADEAWEAGHAGNLALAEKLSRRAVAAGPDNPVLWNDQGVLLGSRGKQDEAAKSFRTALRLAPTFAEAYAHLAALRLRQGFAREAVTLQTQAV